MLTIRLKRFGTKKKPYYRLVVLDSRKTRDGRVLEEVGYYHPISKDNQIKLSKDQIIAWIEKGAQVSSTVKNLLNKNQIYLTRT